jgi:hypothetical protein
MTKFRRRPAPAYDENDRAAGVTETDDEATAKLQSYGLPVRHVTRAPSGNLTIQWKPLATEADRAFASELLPGVAHAC